MTRLFSIILAVHLVFSPTASFAQEAPPAPEGVEGVPVYLFVSQTGEIIGIVPITTTVFVGCAINALAEIPDCAIIEIPSTIYTYGSSTYANPHAVTQYGSTTYAYDTNGNLTSDSIWNHTWNWRNRLTQSSSSNALVTYLYDHADSRVRMVSPSTTLIVASPLYSTENGTAVKHITANGELVATLRGSGTSTVPYWVVTDHLGSAAKTLNASGTIVELSDYYPYGGVRQDAGTLDDRKGYLAKDYDADTGLTQAEARYYKGTIGRFISQDPVFWEIGLTPDGKAVLENPQLQNSYSYANNNPITHSDPEGRIAPLLVAGYKISMFWYNVSNLINDVVDRNIKNSHPDVFSQKQRDDANFRVGYDLTLTALGGAGKYLGLPNAGTALDVLGVAGDATDAWRQQQAQSEAENPNKKKMQSTESSLSTFPSGVGGSYFSPINNSSNQIRVQPNMSYSQGQQQGGGSGGAAYQIQLLQQLVGLYTQLLNLQISAPSTNNKKSP